MALRALRQATSEQSIPVLYLSTQHDQEAELLCVAGICLFQSQILGLEKQLEALVSTAGG